MKKIKEILMLALCISSVISFSEETTSATQPTPITKEEVKKKIEEAVKAQTEKITRLQTSVSKNTQDIDKNKIKYFSAKMGLGGGGNADNDGAKGSLSLAIGDYAISNGKVSTAIGKNSLIIENSEYSRALGSGAYIGKRKEVSSFAIIDSNNGGVFNRWKNGVGSNMV